MIADSNSPKTNYTYVAESYFYVHISEVLALLSNVCEIP